MTEKFFLDTNILLYAADGSDQAKQKVAQSLILSGMKTRKAVVSTQVLQEYFVNATRKLGIPAETVRSTISNYLTFTTVIVQPDDLLSAIDLHRLHQFSFWDSLIVHCASRSGSKVLYSEDLQSGQRIAGLRVENPFLAK